MARYSGPERRRYKRLEISLPVRYKLGQGGLTHRAHTIDIGVGGICLGPVPLSNEWMMRSCEVEIEITLAHLTRPLKALAEVVRVEQSTRPHHIHERCRHNIRLKFCKISEEDKKAIEELVHLKSKS